MSVLEALAGGALLLTANRRLARSWRSAFDEYQLASGLTAWESPAILTWAEWLDQTTAELLPGHAVPSPMAERRGWLRVIESAEDRDILLDARASAQAAAEAWELCRSYGISPRHPAFADAADTRQFAAWALEFERRVERNGWLPRADQEAWLAAEMPELPREVWLDGFEDLAGMSPARRQILARLPNRHRVPEDAPEGDGVLYRPPDARAGLTAAANWARRLLEGGGVRSVGIVVAGLAGQREAVETVFGDVLGAPLFNISLGRPLRSWPIVAGALDLLRWRNGPLPLGRAGALLRSPFLSGGQPEAESRLRRENRMEMSLAEAGFAPPAEEMTPRTPGGWAREIPRMLKPFGWPGARRLSSAELQALRRWEQLLREFAALDIVEGRMPFRQALDLLEDLAADAIFQPETGDMPVQILEALQAAGSRFDALWVQGLADTNWPPPARPHPFLPRRLQREGDLPHSSPERELRVAAEITRRLLRTAPRIVFCVPEREGDVELRPSRLLPELPGWRPEAQPYPTASSVQSGAGEFERFADSAGPALGSAKPSGGTQILAWQAQCPFRAFALSRLGAAEWREPAPGIPPDVRGTLLHQALAHVWRHFRTRARIARASQVERDQVIAQAVALAGLEAGPALLEVERACLRVRVEQLIELDFGRDEFTVDKIEQNVDLSAAGVPLHGRIDRIDVLPDGGRVLIDYKSNAPSTKAWEGERPDQPQLPLYALALQPPPAAVAFAHLKSGEVRYAGLGAAGSGIEGVKAPKDKTWEEQLTEWRRVLAALWEEFASGAAAPAPRDGARTCATCHLHSLCRIRETALGGPDDDGA